MKSGGQLPIREIDTSSVNMSVTLLVGNSDIVRRNIWATF